MSKKRIFTILFIVIFLAEMGLRIFLGFCDDVLMMESEEYEYIAQPLQNRKRFGNQISYNSYSMRSKPVRQNSIKILGLGDSILNGGTLTDQDSLATTQLGNSLSQVFNREIQVLNISAGSWGPDNCYAYLEHFGNFDSSAAFLVVSSHDAYDNMNFKKVVDLEKGFRSKQYELAIFELVDRYILPNDYDQSTEALTHFNTGFESLRSYFATHEIPFVIYLHAEIKELEQGEYQPGGKEIIEFCRVNDIKYISELEYSFNKSHYRDHIHLSESGQRIMADILFQHFQTPNGMLISN